MKVKIKNLQPNPYRDMKNYPINKEKVDSLKQSIEKTGFWDNILARQVNTEIQIAYGHHRLEALKQVMQPDDEVDIPVKELSDALMIQIMANENMEDWKVTAAVIDETVRVAKVFLEAHPEIAKEYGSIEKIKHDRPIGLSFISRFLNWNERRVGCSLERLHLIKEKIINEEAIRILPTEGSARAFVDTVKELGGLSVEKQMEAAERIRDAKRHERAVRDIVIDKKWESPKKKEPEWVDPRVTSYEKYVSELTYKLNVLEQDVLSFKALESELGVIKNMQRRHLHQSLNRFISNIEVLIKNYENENTVGETNLISIGE